MFLQRELNPWFSNLRSGSLSQSYRFKRGVSPIYLKSSNFRSLSSYLLLYTKNLYNCIIFLSICCPPFLSIYVSTIVKNKRYLTRVRIEAAIFIFVLWNSISEVSVKTSFPNTIKSSNLAANMCHLFGALHN